MDLEGVYLDLKGPLLHSLPKSGGAMASLPPGSYVPVNNNSNNINDNSKIYMVCYP